MAHDRTAGELKAELGAEVRRLRERKGWSQQDLANRTGYSSSRGLLSSIENGRECPSADRAAALDDRLCADGRIKRLRAAAWAQEKIERVGLVVGPADGRETAEDAGGAEDAAEGDTTDRREVFQVVGGLTAGAFAAELADRMATADPTPLAMAEIGADVHKIPDAFGVLPDAHLRAQLEPAWMGVERLIDTRVSPPVRNQLTIYAGQYCYYLGWLAYSTGDDEAARAYLMVARRHAAAAGVPLLTGSVAHLHSGLARLTGDYATAADIAADARQGDCHHYVRATLAADEAAAAAWLGQPERARAALADMEAQVWAGAVLPGPEVFDEEAAHAWLAIVLATLREGEAAEGHANSSLDLLRGREKGYLVGGTYNALARAFLRRRRPEPEQAASACAAALHIVDGQPERVVVESAGRTWRELTGRWGTLPAVQDLGEQVVGARKALPA